jgi:hypothetical protein
VRYRPNTTPAAPHHRGVGLDEQFKFAVDLGDVEQDKARQSEQADSISITLSHR